MSHRAGQLVRVALERALVLGVIWWALTDGDPSSVVWGGLAVVLATALSVRLDPSSTRVRLGALARFVATFVWGSVKGGVDVAYRALAPRLPIAPAVVLHRLSVPEGPARNLFLGSVNLMPGTLVVDVDGDEVRIHVLRYEGDATRDELASLERRAAGVFPGASGG